MAPLVRLTHLTTKFPEPVRQDEGATPVIHSADPIRFSGSVPFFLLTGTLARRKAARRHH
jgi:hypothetical protein